MARVADYQRSKVYKAEDAVFDKSKPPEMEALSEVRQVMDEVIASKYWQAQEGWKLVKVADGRGRRSACYKSRRREVCFPLWSRSKWIVIHEMAHCLTDRTTKDGTGHGTHFVGHYLNLVEELLGADVSNTLADAFEERGVRWYGWQRQAEAA